MTSVVEVHCSRLNLNKAAERIAAAFGFKLGHRESLSPSSNRMIIRWTLRQDEKFSDWELTLRCLPPAWGQGGWEGWVELTRVGGPDLISRRFVVFNDMLAGAKARALTRERFCEWAATLEPGSKL